MRTFTVIWIFVGVAMWGLPTGLMSSFMMANFNFVQPVEYVGFQEDKFKTYALIIIPLFSLLGLCLGVYMGRLSEQYKSR